MVSERDISDLLSDRPDLRPALKEALETDTPWTFDDVDIDSGELGELVSSGIVEEVDGGYHVSNSEAVMRALDGGTETTTVPSIRLPASLRSACSFERLNLAVLFALLILTTIFRAVSYPNVFQGSDVVLSGNDAYYYRYHIEQLLSSSDVTLSSLPREVAVGEPLFVGSVFLISKAVGDSSAVVGQILAWYPPVTAVTSGLLLYGTVRVLSRDWRLPLASVAMLAIVPGHAYRTSLGFADHHAFDYLWLIWTAFWLITAVHYATEPESSYVLRVLTGTVGIGVGVVGQTLAWDAGPLLLVPVAVYLTLDSLAAGTRGYSPVRSSGPVVVGCGLGAALTQFVHRSYGWHTELVAATTVVLFAGGVATLIAGVVSFRLGLRRWQVGGVQLIGLFTFVYGVKTSAPTQWDRVLTNVNENLIRTDAIAETGGLLGGSLGWLLLFGFVFVLSLPYLFAATRRLLDQPRWTAFTVYAWYFTALAVVQIRFVGQMAPFVAVFAGIGFVGLTERVDITDLKPQVSLWTDVVPVEVRMPNRATVKSLLLVFLLVGSLSFVQVPVKTTQLTYSDTQYETATWIADYSQDRGVEYPQSYVLSEWGENRFYNYFVSGESRSYNYAKSRYVRFVSSTGPSRWYDKLSGSVGFVVTSPQVVGNESTIGTILHRANGSRTDSIRGVSHYQLVYISDGGQFKLFRLVPGAVVQGSATPNQSVTISTTVTIVGHEVQYERQASAGADGNYSVVVAHPGRYVVKGQTATVPESAVRNGTTVTVGG